METYKNKATAVELPEHKLVFFAAPKVASSSIKKMFFELFFDQPFEAINPDGSMYRIHRDFSGSRRFHAVAQGKYDDWTKITLVRDPVERLLSAYSNKVVDVGMLSEKWLDPKAAENLGVKMNPPLYYFVRNLDKYRILSRSIWHHTDPFTCFLGHDLGYFDRVFSFMELPDLVDFVSNHTGKKAILPISTNSAKTKCSFSDLGIEAKKSLLTFCAGDYALLRDYYKPPALQD